MKKTTLLLLTLVAFAFQTNAQITVSETLTAPDGDIPDAAVSHTTPGVLVRTLNVNSTAVPITDVTVDLEINHTWVGDLIITLESPTGTVVQLIARPGTEPNTGTGFGCSGNDILVLMEDAGADGPGEDGCTVGAAGGPADYAMNGTYGPYDALSGFDTENANGDWILTTNDFGAGDTGAVISWGINISGPTLSTPTNAIEGFSYSPNPVKDRLSLNAANNIENISVYNMLGQQVLRVTPNATTNQLDMSELHSGAYFVKVSVGDVTQTVRIIKQ